MTQEIIELARDSGMELYGLGKDRARFVHHLEVFAKLVAEKALAEHAMRETQRLGQEIEPDDIASILACRDMLDAQPVPEVDRVIWPEHTEQAPVAWIERDIQCDDFDPDSVTCEKPTIATDGWEWVGLYTSPPQRTWVDLTDEDISEIAINNPPMVHEFARAVLTKSKEKNT